MNAIDEAHQEKLLFLQEYNHTLKEFNSFKQEFGILPKDSIYMELKENVLRANDNYNRARTSYNELLFPREFSNVPTQAMNNQRLAEQTVDLMDLLMRLKIGAPKVTATKHKTLYFMLNACHVLAMLCVVEIIVFPLVSNWSPTGMLLIFPSVFGLYSLHVKNSNMLALFSWLKILFTVMELVIFFNSPSLLFNPFIIIIALLRLLMIYFYLYCVQKIIDGHDFEESQILDP